jgi:hypothetical protein
MERKQIRREIDMNAVIERIGKLGMPLTPRISRGWHSSANVRSVRWSFVAQCNDRIDSAGASCGKICGEKGHEAQQEHHNNDGRGIPGLDAE